MTLRRHAARIFAPALVLTASSFAPAAADGGEGPGRTASQAVTWTCTGEPCPWGPRTSGHAAVWPEDAVSSRYGYTTSAAIYLPGAVAEGATITVLDGAAGVWAGPLDGPHRSLRSLSAGDSFTVGDLPAGEVLSLQNDDAAFAYTFTAAEEAPPDPDPTPTPTPSPTPTHEPGAESAPVTWSCTGDPCPWGASTSGNAVAWPETSGAITTRHGYTTSEAVYLPAASANGDTLAVVTGTATLFAGTPGGPHRSIARLSAGEQHTVTGLATDQVLSVQNDDAPFSYVHTPGDVTPPDPEPTPTPTPTVPAGAVVLESTLALWHCDAYATCADDGWAPWVGGAVAWPEEAAYSTNAREGSNSRTVRDLDGEVIHPYMGSWADGCRIHVLEGDVLVIEWQRGTDTWRPTYLSPGDVHTIELVGDEDGAMIETPDTPTTFTVALTDCTPQPVS